MLVTLPAVIQDVSEMPSSAILKEQADNRKCLFKTLCTLQFLAQQGCVFGEDSNENLQYSPAIFFTIFTSCFLYYLEKI